MIGGEALPPIIQTNFNVIETCRGDPWDRPIGFRINVRATHRVAPNGARLLWTGSNVKE